MQLFSVSVVISVSGWPLAAAARLCLSPRLLTCLANEAGGWLAWLSNL